MSALLRSPAFVRAGVLTMLLWSLAAIPLQAQETEPFNDTEAADELSDISEYLTLEEVDLEYLATSHSRVAEIQVAAAACVAANEEVRNRLQARFEPLKDVDTEATDVSPEMLQHWPTRSITTSTAVASQLGTA